MKKKMTTNRKKMTAIILSVQHDTDGADVQVVRATDSNKLEQKVKKILPAIMKAYLLECDGVEKKEIDDEDVQDVIDGEVFSPSCYTGEGFVQVIILPAS
jgi:hypothetical protein